MHLGEPFAAELASIVEHLLRPKDSSIPTVDG
jgi:hypothetical protein